MGTRRRQERLQTSLPVRIWGMDTHGKPFSVSAKTADITRHGARIVGVPTVLQKDEIVGVQHGDQKARFRVVWCGKPGTRTNGQVGLYALEPERSIWGDVLNEFEAGEPELVDINFDEIQPTKIEPTLRLERPTTASRDHFIAVVSPRPDERRLATRFPCKGSVEIAATNGTKLWGSLVDVSLSGCYVHTVATLPSRTRVEARITTDGIEIRCDAEVRAIHEGVGMGLLFLHPGPAARERLDLLLSMLAKRKFPAADSSQADANEELVPERSATEKSAQLSSIVYQLTSQIRELQLQATSGCELEEKLLGHFREAVQAATDAGWALQQWIERREQNRDGAEILAEFEGNRLKRTAATLLETLDQIDDNTFDPQRPGMTDLVTATVQLYKRLALLAEKRRSTQSGR